MRKLLQRIKFWKKNRQDEEGQGIVEYAMVIAFVAVLISFAFAMSRGTIFEAVSNAYSNCNSALNALNVSAEEAGK